MSDIYKAPEAPLTDPSQESGEYGSLETALKGEYELSPIQVIKDAWESLEGFKTTFWLAALAYMGVAIVVSIVLGLVFGLLTGFAEQGALAAISAVLQQIASTLILGPLAAGMYMLAIKFSVGSRIEVGELFKYFHKMIPLFLMTLLMYATVFIGLILLVLPGIYLMVAYAFAIPLMVEKNMGPWEALNTSRKIITHKWFNMLGFMIVASIVVLLGALALLVGLLWAVPLTTLATAFLYRDIIGVETSTLEDSLGRPN